jgi:hypothetical protein
MLKRTEKKVLVVTATAMLCFCVSAEMLSTNHYFIIGVRDIWEVPTVQYCMWHALCRVGYADSTLNFVVVIFISYNIVKFLLFLYSVMKEVDSRGSHAQHCVKVGSSPALLV